MRGSQRYLRKHALLLLRDYAVIMPSFHHVDLLVLHKETTKTTGLSDEMLEVVESASGKAIKKVHEENEKDEEVEAPTTKKQKKKKKGDKALDVDFFTDIFNIKFVRILKALRMLQQPQVLKKLTPNTIERVVIPFLIAEFVKSMPSDVRIHPTIPARSAQKSDKLPIFCQENDRNKLTQMDGNIINEVR